MEKNSGLYFLPQETICCIGNSLSLKDLARWRQVCKEGGVHEKVTRALVERVLSWLPTKIRKEVKSHWVNNLSGKDPLAWEMARAVCLYLDRPWHEDKDQGETCLSDATCQELTKWKRVSGLALNSEEFSAGISVIEKVRSKTMWANCTYRRSRTTPLHWAAMKGSVNVCRVLIKNGARINQGDNLGVTALDYAAGHGRLDNVKLLIKNGADVNRYAGLGPPMMWAVVHGHLEVASLLHKSGADVNQGRPGGETCLHWAVSKGDFEAVKLLIKMDADVKAKDGRENTFLHIAAENGYSDVVELLIDAGADVNAKDDWDNTPLHLAAENGYSDVVQLLLEKGANVNAVNWFTYTPLDFAYAHKRYEVQKILVQRGADWWDALWNSPVETIFSTILGDGFQKTALWRNFGSYIRGI